MPPRESRILRECSCCTRPLLGHCRYSKFKYDVAIVLAVGRLQGKLELLDQQEGTSTNFQKQSFVSCWATGTLGNSAVKFAFCHL
jgi:hypothetical protein